MKTIRYITPAGAVRFSKRNGMVVIHSGNDGAINFFVNKKESNAVVHKSNPIAMGLKGWKREGDWFNSPLS